MYDPCVILFWPISKNYLFLDQFFSKNLPVNTLSSGLGDSMPLVILTPPPPMHQIMVERRANWLLNTAQRISWKGTARQWQPQHTYNHEIWQSKHDTIHNPIPMYCLMTLTISVGRIPNIQCSVNRGTAGHARLHAYNVRLFGKLDFIKECLEWDVT